MSVSFSSKVVLSSEVLLRELSGEAVMLHLGDQHYYALDTVGTRMLQMACSSTSIEDAYQQLIAEFDVDPETLHSDLEELLQELLEQKLIRLE